MGRRLARVHEGIRGPGYHAGDPELIWWVAATYFDSVMAISDLLVRPPFDTDVLYEQMKLAIEILGCPAERQPQTFAAFKERLAEWTGGLVVTDEARSLAQAIFWPSTLWRHRVPLAALRILSFGLLNPALRDAYGYDWGTVEQNVFAGVRFVGPVLRPSVDLLFRHLADGRGRPVTVMMAFGGFRPSESATAIQ